MLDELKQLLDLVAKLPEVTLWVLGGFAAYKLVMFLSTTGAIVLIAKLLIVKAHDAITKPKPREVCLDRKFITSDLTYDEFLSLINELITIRGRQKDHGLNYVFKDDVAWLRIAMKEKAEREEKK